MQKALRISFDSKSMYAGLKNLNKLHLKKNFDDDESLN